MQNRVLAEDFDTSRVVGRHITELDASLDFETAYPVVDPATFRVVDIIDGNYPPYEYETGAIVDGEVVTGEHYSQFAIRTYEEEES